MRLLYSIALLVFISFNSCKKDVVTKKPPVVIVKKDSLSIPVLISPLAGTEITAKGVLIQWQKVDSAKLYKVNISADSSFASILKDTSSSALSYKYNDSLPNGKYFWRILAQKDTVLSKWSEIRSIIVNITKPVELPIVPAGTKVKKLSTTSYQFLEGPVWDGKGNLYFSDFDNNNVYPGQNHNFIRKYTPSTNTFSIFRSKSNKSNGLMFDALGRLIDCEGDSGRITALSDKGYVTEVLASSFGGKRLNSPNDLVIDADGGIYFTDPTWGTQLQGLNGVYYWAANGTVTRIVSNMSKPNGIIISPDGTKLYIGDSESAIVRVYTITAPGSISATYTKIILKSSGPDGVAMDVKGDIYFATSIGIQIFKANGTFVQTISVPEGPSNCDFGGDNMKTLFITAQTSLYSINLNVEGQSYPLKK